MDSITLDEALQLFELPRTLGQLPTGEKVGVGVGRFGPYVKYGDKFVSLKTDDPYTIDFPRALEVIAEKKVADAERTICDFGVDGVQVLKGRFGPYITDGKRNAKIPKEREPASMTLDECRALLAVAPLRGTTRFGRKKVAGRPGATAGAAAEAGGAGDAANDAGGAKSAARSAKAAKKSARPSAGAVKAAPKKPAAAGKAAGSASRGPAGKTRAKATAKPLSGKKKAG
jgi:DNA topoisomerase-1